MPVFVFPALGVGQFIRQSPYGLMKAFGIALFVLRDLMTYPGDARDLGASMPDWLVPAWTSVEGADPVFEGEWQNSAIHFCMTLFLLEKFKRYGQRFENWKLRRAFGRPYFLRSTARGSRVRNPPGFSATRRAGS